MYDTHIHLTDIIFIAVYCFLFYFNLGVLVIKANSQSTLNLLEITSNQNKEFIHKIYDDINMDIMEINMECDRFCDTNYKIYDDIIKRNG